MHVRKSQDQVRSAAAKAGVRRGIAHAFNGSPDQARHFAESGFKLGFGGVFTFSRANRIRRLAAEVPVESIVLETDAPDLAPAWLADDQFSEQVGTRNAPAEVAGIAAALAELRGISMDALAAQMRRNSIDAIPRLAALLDP
jgi:TatD DNase family protein